jgi:group I intron endonuclease
MYVIYEIKNIINDWRYIGCSKNVKTRWAEHKLGLQNNKHHNIHLQRAWNKYGEGAFEWNITLELDNENIMFLTEADMISSNQNLYNISDGGMGGDVFTNHPNKEQYRKNMSVSQKEAMKDPLKRKRRNPFRDVTAERDVELRKIWSEASKGSKNGRFKYDKKVLKLDKKTGDVLKVYDYVRLVDEDEFNSKYVIHCCNGKKSYYSHKGFKWKWDG